MISILPFLNNPKDLDPSYKMDLDLWDCFGREKKSLSYNRRNTVTINIGHYTIFSFLYESKGSYYYHSVFGMGMGVGLTL